MKTTPNPYKYNLNEIFVRIYGRNAGEAKKECAEIVKVNLTTFYRDANISAASINTIPKQRLELYAQFLNCHYAELRNPSTKSIIPCKTQQPANC